MRRLLAAALTLAALVPGTAAAAVVPARLLQTFAPVVVLHPDERFPPAAVEGFLNASELQLKAPDGSWGTVGPGTNPLPVTGSGWRLDYSGCSPETGASSLDCYAALPQAAPAVYARAVTLRDRVLLQYWLWSTYDFWSALYPPSDFLWQAHEGDWEAVTVVLTRAGTPLYAGYSQHCSGARRIWARVPKEPRTKRPIVYVALGSHSNWFGPGRHQIDVRCYPQVARAIFPAYLEQVLDYTGRGVVVRPPLVRVTDRVPAWMRYPGSWGEDQFFHAPDPITTVRFGTSPPGPAFQDLWRTPIREVSSWRLG